MSQSQNKRQIKLYKNRRTPGKQKGIRNRSNLSTKKSSKSANPKSAGNVINFYPSREEAEGIVEPEVIKHRWKPLKRIPAITIQHILLTKELDTEWKEPKQNKKSKKQKKLEWEARYGNENPEI